jgi:hypothetical protein
MHLEKGNLRIALVLNQARLAVGNQRNLLLHLGLLSRASQAVVVSSDIPQLVVHHNEYL